MVFYLTPSERRLLFRRYFTWARREPPSEEWRGWSWDSPPLEPPYDVVLTLHEVASQHCSTGRDVYLRRVEGIKPPPNERMIRGLVLHSVVERAIVEAKKALYSGRARTGDELACALSEIEESVLSGALKPAEGLSEGARSKIEGMARSLWRFEAIQIASNLDRALADNPRAGLDALVNTAIPFVVERCIDGSFLGLSDAIRVDALAHSRVVLDLKTGRKREFQELFTAGYALALEAELEGPVDVGVVVYLDFASGKPHVSREMHLVDEALRREFIEERNRKMRIVAEELDPGIAESCPGDCPFYPYCRGRGS